MLQADENLKLRIYNEAIVLQSHDTIADLEEAKRKFLLLGDYKDSAKQGECCAARINKFVQKNERKALQNGKSKRTKVIILVAILVAIIALPCFYGVARSASSDKRIPVLKANLINNAFKNAYELDYFEFNANGRGYHYYYYYNNWFGGLVRDEFYWQVVIPLVGRPRVMITYQNSSRENFEFIIYTDGHDKPLCLIVEEGLFDKGLEYKLDTNR